MDEKEFQRQIKGEMNTGVSDAQFDKVMQAFGDRQARKSGAVKKILRARNLSIFAATVTVVAVIVLSVVFWPHGGGNTAVSFNSDTPHLDLTSFEEVIEHTGADIKLPIEFDEGYNMLELKVYFPKENEPCAVEVSYEKLVSENEYARIKITIVLADNVLFYDEASYDRCNIQSSTGEISYVYFLKDSEQRITCLAKFRINGKDYYYEAQGEGKPTLDLFIISL